MINRDVTIHEQRRVIEEHRGVIIDLQSQLMDKDRTHRGLQVSYRALQDNYAYLATHQERQIEKINIERDNLLMRYMTLEERLEGDESAELASMLKLTAANERLTEENTSLKNTAVKHKFDLFKRHIIDWRCAFLQLDIYCHGLESLLHVRKLSRDERPRRPKLIFDVSVKQELGNDLEDMLL